MKNGKIGVGFFGFGFIGKVHAWGYANLPFFFDPVPLGTEFIGVCTSRRETAEKARAVAPFSLATTNWQELVADPRIGILHCCAPNALHAGFLLEAIAAGKHVYTEKPLAVTREDGLKAVLAAREKGVRLGCAPGTFLGG
ncbi:MAG: Gfo/Idh/MocA family oxidoreductase, partial [Planctomycetota bacterium]|nr:Gfo/Idh/MocA family oxidoreductase [Planctomycetota bacterium]